MPRIIYATRWFRIILVMIVLALIASVSVGALYQKEAPEAKLPASEKEPSKPPIVLPPDMELDIESDPFAVIPAETAGKVKWVVHVDGYNGKIATFSHPSAPILIVAVPKTGFVLVTAISAVKDEPYFAQTRVRAKQSERPAAPTTQTPSQKLDVNLLYDLDKKTPELQAILDSDIGKRLAAEGHAFHSYDYRQVEAKNRKLTENVAKPGVGLPALIILDKSGWLLPDGKPIPVPTSSDKILDLVRKIAS